MSKTVLVLGAGASCELGLPSGADLKDRLVGMLNFRFEVGQLETGDTASFETIRARYPRDYGDSLKAARQICAGLPHSLSIDNYLDQQRGDTWVEFVGKVGIVHAILQAEAGSRLQYVPATGQPNIINASGTWLNEFFMLLCQGCTADSLAARFSRLALIIFNYDRCFELFLYYALQVVYPSLGPTRAAELVNSIEIYHPYGTVGRLLWQPESPIPVIDLGGRYATPEQLAQVATSSIKTFTESIESGMAAQIEDCVRQAGRLAFLGFAYYQQNLDLLFAGSPPRPYGISSNTLCFGSTYGLSGPNTEVIKRDLIRRGAYNNEAVTLANAKCADFIRNFSRQFDFRD